MKLSILIATTIDRRPIFNRLLEEFMRQKTDDVQVLWDEDNKEISVGAKRQKLLLAAEGDYIVYFDSDDFPYPYYVGDILAALEKTPDCVGFLIHMTTNGRNPQTCCHSLRFKKWEKNRHGYDYVRGVTHFNPVKRELALQIGFPDIRFGEDKVYSDRITRICRKEVFVNKRLFHYRYTNSVPHKLKYGL